MRLYRLIHFLFFLSSLSLLLFFSSFLSRNDELYFTPLWNASSHSSHVWCRRFSWSVLIKATPRVKPHRFLWALRALACRSRDRLPIETRMCDIKREWYWVDIAFSSKWPGDRSVSHESEIKFHDRKKLVRCDKTCLTLSEIDHDNRFYFSDIKICPLFFCLIIISWIVA